MVKRGHGGKTALQRLKKWDLKLKGSTTAILLEASKPLGRLKETLYQYSYQNILNIARNLTARYPQYVATQQEIVSYLERLWYFIQRYRGEALQVMADATFLYWKARGFDEGLLRDAAAALGINISGWDTLLGRLGLSQEVIYQAMKKALEDAGTLRAPEVQQDPIDYKYTYDPATGRITEVLITNLRTGKQRKIIYTYDAQGNLIEAKEEDVS